MGSDSGRQRRCVQTNPNGGLRQRLSRCRVRKKVHFKNWLAMKFGVGRDPECGAIGSAGSACCPAPNSICFEQYGPRSFGHWRPTPDRRRRSPRTFFVRPRASEQTAGECHLQAWNPAPEPQPGAARGRKLSVLLIQAGKAEVVWCRAGQYQHSWVDWTLALSRSWAARAHCLEEGSLLYGRKFSGDETKRGEDARRDASSPGNRRRTTQFPETLTLQEGQDVLRSGVGLREGSHAGLQ
jgi:hypothetical protein